MTLPPTTGVALLASIDSFWIMVAIGIGSAMVEWWQKRKKHAADQDPGHAAEPPPEVPRPAVPQSNWEEELRRMLGSEHIQRHPGGLPATEGRPSCARAW